MYKLNANNGIISVIQTDRDQINMIRIIFFIHFLFRVNVCVEERWY